MLSGKRKIGIAAVMLALSFWCGMRVEAEEEIQPDTLWQTGQSVEVKEGPDAQSETVGTLPEGTPVIVRGKGDAGWYRIQYQEMTGYVPQSALAVFQAEQPDALEQEFSQVGAELSRLEDEYSLMKTQNRSASLWKIAVIVMSIAMVGVGVYSVLREKEKSGSKPEK